jgi:hypothetical protein
MKNRIARHKPQIKMPEHFSTTNRCVTKEDKIDAQMADSFPASDPPSYSGGNHIVGAPSDRQSTPAGADHPAVVAAEKKIKQGGRAQPHK